MHHFDSFHRFCRLASFSSLAAVIPFGAATAQVPEPALTRFTYAVVSGPDTSWHYILRLPVSFSADVLVPKQGASIQLIGVLDNASQIRRLMVGISPNGATGVSILNAAQQAAFEVSGDSVFGFVRSAHAQQDQRYPAPAGSIIFQWNYLVLLEQIVFRARAMGSSTAQIPVYLFGTQGVVVPATVRLPAGTDSAIVTVGKKQYRLVLDKYKRIESARSNDQEVRRVSPRPVFPPDTAATQNLRCPEAPQRFDLAEIRAAPPVRDLLSLYPAASQAHQFRTLRNASDLSVCKEILDMFPTQGAAHEVLELGDAYVLLIGTPAQNAGVVVLSRDLSVGHLTRYIK